MKQKKCLSVLLATMMAVNLTACGGPAQEEMTPETSEPSTVSQPETEAPTEQVTTVLDAVLDLNNYASKWIYVTEMEKTERGDIVLDDNGNPVMEAVRPCYALMDIAYCINPADASVQKIDLYVPEEYMNATDNGDGTFTCTVKREGAFTRSDGVTYTGATAPIIYQNTIDGYAEGAPISLTSGRKGANVGTYNDYLESGYVLASIACRGIDSTVDGTAPAAVVDLKAGIRMLKANSELVPGDTDRIIATGVSAGGAVTSVIGASGNSELYTPYLEEMGAIMDSTDDVYAAMVFCPITNLNIADAAFEWLHSSETAAAGGFGGFGDFGGMGGFGGPGGDMGNGFGGPDGADGGFGGPGGGINGPNGTDGGFGGPGGNMVNDFGEPDGADGGFGGLEIDDDSGEFSEFEIALHEALYTQYLTDLEALGIDPSVFYDGFLDEINECIAYYVDNYVDDVDAFVAENSYLSYDGKVVTSPDVETFVSESMGRTKGVPSFDALDSTNKENNLFDGKHFSSELLAALETLSADYSEAANVLDSYREDLTDERLQEVILMTPNTFLSGAEDSTVAAHWRFRNGTTDGDVGSVAAWQMTQLLLRNPNVEDVDFGLVWGVGHMAADYSYEDVQAYVESMCQ